MSCLIPNNPIELYTNTSVCKLVSKSFKNLNHENWRISLAGLEEQSKYAQQSDYLRISDAAKDKIVENQSLIWNKLKTYCI